MKNVRNQFINHKMLSEKGINLTIKREDEIHPYISGNKYRKLKYNIIEAKNKGYNSILSFGGAYSNHISALSYAGKQQGFKTIGVIRGEELAEDLQKTLSENPTLNFAHQQGMQLKFISRTEYRNKEADSFMQSLRLEYGNFYALPEGGSNDLAIKGCEEILTDQDDAFDFICVSVGTGGTISGLINSANPRQYVLGFPSLKGLFLEDVIRENVSPKSHWKLIHEYHFGGYAKINENLIRFINDFYQQTTIPLDPIYTGKTMFGILDLAQKDYFKKNSSILMIHTGGLQGIEGMNQRLLKGFTIINNMKNLSKFSIVVILLFMIVSCGSKKSTSGKSKKKEINTREAYLYDKSDRIYQSYKKENQGKVNDFTIVYIGTYKDIAIDKMEKYKIPASITLAQGILESGNGLSTLAKKSNNHFGIKCHSGWKGKKVYHDDDKKGECFRKYDTAEGSFNDHSKFLTGRGRYEFLFDLKPDDYKAWAKGLKKAGYATDRKYPKKLISFIETFELYKYDELVLDQKSYKKYMKDGNFESEPQGSTVVSREIASNESKVEEIEITDDDVFVTVVKGDTLYSIAKNNNLSVDDLKRINGLDSNELSIGMKLLVTK